ncbi:MAG: hypothetical protein DRN95_00635 [Candidatus Hydrothermarchaeota archaeon]|nr:MAG: hypothetical protein DRN95_00635 [Candidatus Hydrothermarchaeota archaeon]
MDWTKINVISNIILVFALVAVTFWYAKKISDQTQLMIKDRERNKILEEIREVISSSIHQLEDEIQATNEGSIIGTS